jgi:hypothetical protein
MTNKDINLLVAILTPLMLDLEKSSARRRFLRLLKNFKEDSDLEGEYIRKEYGDKNPDGSLKVIDNQIQFTLENRKLAEVKFKALNDLEIPVDFKGEEKDLEVIKKVLIGLLEKEKTAKEITNDTAEYIFILEGIILQLSTIKEKSKK